MYFYNVKSQLVLYKNVCFSIEYLSYCQYGMWVIRRLSSQFFSARAQL